jgi:uncharacterized protein YgfB (UPF0149 family)
MQPQVPLSVDVMEVLNDFGQLAEVEVPDASGEDDENYFMELVEYVRMAAIAVFQQMQEAEPALAADDKEEPGLHFADPGDDQLLH